MKGQVALLGALLLAWNVAIANVDCTRAPYGEGVAQYGRDEFQLGILSGTRGGDHPPATAAMFRKADREMRAACLARFYGEDLARYARLGLPPRRLATESVGSIAAIAIDRSGPRHRSSGAVPAPSDVAAGSPPAGRPSASGETREPTSPAPAYAARVISNFPACPRKVDLKRILAAALIDTTEWPQAEAAGKRHGCIELHAGDRVDRVETDRWGGMIRVRRAGHTGTYWTDSMVVR